MLGSTSALALETFSKLRFYHFEDNWQNQEFPHISLPSDLVKGTARENIGECGKRPS